MRQIYFCDIEKSKEILSGLSLKEEVSWSIFENRIEFETFVGDRLYKENIPQLLDFRDDKEINISMFDGTSFVIIKGEGFKLDFSVLPKVLGLDNSFCSAVDSIGTPSCPLLGGILNKDVFLEHAEEYLESDVKVISSNEEF